MGVEAQSPANKSEGSIKTAAVIGYGRFGELLCSVLKEDFAFSVIESDKTKAERAGETYPLVNLSQIADFDFVFLAVPINSFEAVLEQIAPMLHEGQVIVDICSVKVYPSRLMEKLISGAQIIATHPLFGPDSAALGLEGLKVAFSPIRCEINNANHLRYAWERLGVEVIDTTPEEHDKDTSYSQAFTYSIARIINNMGLPRSVEFDTRSYQAIKRVARLSANDTDELFHDMMHYNPYFPAMLEQLEGSWEETLQTLGEIKSEEKPEVFHLLPIESQLTKCLNIGTEI